MIELKIQGMKKNSVEISKTQYLDPKNIESAWADRGMQIENKEELFYLLSSLNLLNSAIKLPLYKRRLNYGGIKKNVSRVIKYLIAQKSVNNLFDQLFIDPDDLNCACISLYGLQFTFHQIPLDKTLSSFIHSKRNKVEQWEGYKLQKVANDLYELSKEISK